MSACGCQICLEICKPDITNQKKNSGTKYIHGSSRKKRDIMLVSTYLPELPVILLVDFLIALGKY